jgi:hypothetical protein
MEVMGLEGVRQACKRIPYAHFKPRQNIELMRKQSLLLVKEKAKSCQPSPREPGDLDDGRWRLIG